MSTGDELQLLGRLMDVAVLTNQVHAANLANSNTPGCKAKAVAFDDAFQSALTGGGAPAALSLSSYLRINFEVNIISLGELTFEVFRNSLRNPAVINVLSIAPIQKRAVATMDMTLAFSLIDRMLGGPGKPLDKMRALTTSEQSLLDNVVRCFLEQLSLGWKELLGFNPVVESREMDPQFVQVIPSSEMVLVATISVTAPNEIEPGEMCFCIPFISLQELVGRLGNQFRFAAMTREQTPAQRHRLDRVVRQTKLGCKVVLWTTTLSISEVMAMQSGDVLVLDQRSDAQLTGYVAAPSA